MSAVVAHTALPGAPAPTEPMVVDPAWAHWLAQRFAWHRLTVRQKLLTIAQRYTVCNEWEQPLFHVVRPPRLTMNILAGIAAGAVRLVTLLLAIRFGLRGDLAIGLGFLVIGSFLSDLVGVLLAPYRDIRVYADESEGDPLLLITQDNKFGLHMRYTIHDALGQPVAYAQRNVLLGLLRRNWAAYTLDNRLITRVLEDNIVLALLRRYLGPLYGLLRTNFDIQLPDGRRVGEYNRKLTLTDQYVLDLSGDPHYLVDRRVCLTLAILLDSAERR